MAVAVVRRICCHNDMPIMVSGAYLFTTADRARHLKQEPVYILNHATSRTGPRSLTPTLDEVEEDAARSARKIYEGAGITANVLATLAACRRRDSSTRRGDLRRRGHPGNGW